MADHVNEALRTLKAARDDTLARLAAIDRAITELGEVEALGRPVDLPGRQTLVDRVRRLLTEQSHIEWNASMVVKALREEYFPGLNEADPEPAVRTSLSRLAAKGAILRTSYGYYRGFESQQAANEAIAQAHRDAIEDEIRAFGYDNGREDSPF